MVIVVREDRLRDSRAKRWSSSLFYKVFRFLTKNMIEENAGDFRLMSRRIVQ